MAYTILNPLEKESNNLAPMVIQNKIIVNIFSNDKIMLDNFFYKIKPLSTKNLSRFNKAISCRMSQYSFSDETWKY